MIEVVVSLSVVILAAGNGSRMQSACPKVMHPIMGLPMLGHVLREVAQLKPNQVIVVTGSQATIERQMKPCQFYSEKCVQRRKFSSHVMWMKPTSTLV